MAIERHGNVLGKLGSGAAWLRIGPWLIAAAATTAVVLTLSPDGAGPGITCDEYYDARAGKALVAALLRERLAFFNSTNIDRNFGPLTLHPPLGRWLLGATHWLFDPSRAEPFAVWIAAARLAPALAFGALVVIVGCTSGRADGPLAGTAAAAATALVPNMFGHAHLATLDTFAAVSYVAAVLALVSAEERGAKTWHVLLAGAVWGLALLTKIQGFLLVVPVVAWFIWHRGWRGLAPMTIWATTGLVVFFAGWPWLWVDPLERMTRFLATATDRQALHVFYLGRVWDDVAVPWHYPWVMFVVTMPVGLLLLGAVGVWSRRTEIWRDRRLSLLFVNLVWVLAVFSWPGTPVYDGIRLFLMVVPLWAVWVGLGTKWLAELPWLARFSPRLRPIALLAFLALQGVGIVIYHPVQLSHYSLLVGGLFGAERLGFEVSYWGEAVRGPFLARAVPPVSNQCVLYGPHLAQFQALAVQATSRVLLENRVELIGWEPSDHAPDCRYAVIYHRRADLAALDPLIRGGRVIAEDRRQGVWLARWYASPPLPDERSRASNAPDA